MVTIPKAKYHTMQGAHQNREAIYNVYTVFFFFYNVAERNVLAIFKANYSLKRFIELFLHTFFSLNFKNSNGSIL